jgi:hypothetical protein
MNDSNKPSVGQAEEEAVVEAVEEAAVEAVEEAEAHQHQQRPHLNSLSP